MAFDRGTVSFVRLRVEGESPIVVDAALLEKLGEHRFRESDIGTPDEVEAGFITGEHIYDVDFSYEKNGFGDRLLWAMRLDTHKAPADVMRAYRRMNEQAARDASPTGQASRRELREAKELAERQVREDRASGRFRKSKAVPLLWDFKRKELLIGSATQTAIEHASLLVAETFDVKLSVISAGVRAGEVLRGQGKGRDYEDLQPSKFTGPPAMPARDRDADDEGFAGGGDLSVPLVPWVAKAVDLKDFLGNEWLMWLWRHAETSDDPIETGGNVGPVHVFVDRALDMECAWDAGGKQTLRGDGPGRLAEATAALRTGKWPRKAGLVLSDGESQWSLTLQADKLQVSACTLPEIDDAQSPREVVDLRLNQIRRLVQLLDGCFEAFIAERTSGRWPTARTDITKWIKARGGQAPTPASATATSPEPASVA